MKWSEVEAACDAMLEGALSGEEWFDFVGRLGRRHLNMLVAYQTGQLQAMMASLGNFRKLLARPISSTHCPHPCDLVRALPR